MIAPLALTLAVAATGPSDYEFTTSQAKLRADAVGDFIEQLADPKKGRAAAAHLVRLGRSAVEQLVGALDHKSPQVRYYAAAALDAIGDRRGARALLRRLADAKEHALVRKIAARAMGHAGYEPAARVLVRLAREGIATDPDTAQGSKDGPGKSAVDTLAADDQDFRFEVIRALAYIGAPEGDDVLLASLSDGSARVRAVAATGLGDNLVLAGLESLRKALSDPDPAVAASAAKALSRFSRRASAAVPDLVKALDREDARVHRACIGALVLATGRSFRTASRWREWWKQKQNPTARRGSRGALEEEVPLPAVDAREVLKNLRSKPSRKDRPTREKPKRTPPALRMPWETDEAEGSD
ncbi:MAG: HEAT repeat domain-containing protein [Planctomycetota bacterium]